MLVIIDDAGVPSVAKMIQVGSASPPPPPPPPPPPNDPPTITLDQPANGATFTGPATVHLAATASDPGGHVWVVQFYSNGTKIGEDQTAGDGFAFDWTGVGAGTYALTAKATDNDDASTTTPPTSITVTAPGSANQPPATSITSPQNNASFPYKPTITITATATDDRAVTRVEFLDGTTVLGSDTSSPYSYTWRNVPSGIHTLRSRATDNAGAVTTSTPITITVRKRG
jgi:hypothetical protein